MGPVGFVIIIGMLGLLTAFILHVVTSICWFVSIKRVIVLTYILHITRFFLWYGSVKLVQSLWKDIWFRSRIKKTWTFLCFHKEETIWKVKKNLEQWLIVNINK